MSRRKVVRCSHCIGGEMVHVTLDGLPAWRCTECNAVRRGPAPVELHPLIRLIHDHLDGRLPAERKAA